MKQFKVEITKEALQNMEDIIIILQMNYYLQKMQ